jgi:hypothetical protein
MVIVILLVKDTRKYFLTGYATTILSRTSQHTAIVFVRLLLEDNIENMKLLFIYSLGSIFYQCIYGCIPV